MSIEWIKLEQRPDKEVKVSGKFLTDFRDRVVDQEREISSLKEKIDKLVELKIANEATINELQDKVVVDLQSRIADQEKEITSLQSDVDKLSKLGEEKDALINDLKENAVNLEASIKEDISTIAKLNGKIEGLQASLDKTISEKDKQIKELMEDTNATKTELDERIRGLEGDKSMLEDSETSLKTQLADMESSYEVKIANLEADFKNQISDLESQRDSVDQEKQAIQIEKDELASKLQFMDEQFKAKDFEYFRKLSKERAERASKAYQSKE
jgi:chromosome segregation ATPase